MKTSPALGCVLLLMLSLISVSGALDRQEFIFTKAPFDQCHASTIEESSHGLVAAWFGGSRERNPDVGIWVSRYDNGSWTSPVEVADGVQYTYTDGSVFRYPCWNPVLFQPSTGALMLFYKVGPSPQQWWGMLKTSIDGGLTWSEARRLPPGILGPIKNRPIELSDGTIICPSSDESNELPSYWRVHFETTMDHGRTWARTYPANDGIQLSAIQPSLLRGEAGELFALGRTRQGKVFKVHSSDDGRTWGRMSLTELPNPNSGTDAVTLKDGRHLIVYNHTIRGRSPLNLAISRDGRAWEAVRVLESEPGEYSYPAIIQTNDGMIHITYTWKRERIKHVVIDPYHLKSQPMVDGMWPTLLQDGK